MPPKKKGRGVNNAGLRKVMSEAREAREYSRVRTRRQSSEEEAEFGIPTKQAAAKVPKLTEF